MGFEERLKTLLGEKDFAIVSLQVQIFDLQKKLDDLTNQVKSNSLPRQNGKDAEARL
jgi:hypothetical protein